MPLEIAVVYVSAEHDEQRMHGCTCIYGTRERRKRGNKRDIEIKKVKREETRSGSETWLHLCSIAPVTCVVPRVYMSHRARHCV